MSDSLVVVVDGFDVGKRLDKFLAEESDILSRARIQALILEGGVTVCGRREKCGYRLSGGEVIELRLPELKEPAILPEDIPLDILYEDGELIVVNKCRGMVVHPAPRLTTGTLVNALLFHCGDSLSGINGVTRPGIVHRIDRMTSGLLVAAKTDAAHAALSAQLASHAMKRVYTAIACGNIKEIVLDIDLPIGRSARNRKKMAVDKENGRRAVTHVSVLERLGRYTLTEVRLETGRTHQIRVHLAYLGYPLLGDTVYGWAKQPFNADGQALHAGTLGFVHPSGEYMEFSVPPPDEFMRLKAEISGRGPKPLP